MPTQPRREGQGYVEGPVTAQGWKRTGGPPAVDCAASYESLGPSRKRRPHRACQPCHQAALKLASPPLRPPQRSPRCRSSTIAQYSGS